jgi:cleavage and polyadenylation specificity factor subunit 1
MAGQKSDFQPSTSFVRNLQTTMAALKPFVPVLPDRDTFAPRNLHTTSHVYVRHDAVKKPLQRPYDGPFRVIRRYEKYFILDKNGKQDAVSLDRIKPAYLEGQQDVAQIPDQEDFEFEPQDDLAPEAEEPAAPAEVPVLPHVPAREPQPPQLVHTRAGRVSRPPERLNL